MPLPELDPNENADRETLRRGEPSCIIVLVVGLRLVFTVEFCRKL